ncbi:MAG: rhomboid family intramembrane serine protease [Chitinophagaceae bacterium]
MQLSITVIIIIITSLVSFSAFSNEKLMNGLIFYPPAIHKNNQWYRFFSNGLLHADLTHLLFNMFSLYLFGRLVETSFSEIFGETGKLLYLAMYVLALGACLIPTYNKNKENYHYRSLGASGAVSAVIFASILLNPLMGMGLFFIPVFIAAFLFGFIYLAVSSWLDIKGGGNINHSAHIFGALFGVGFMIVACRLFSDYPVLENFINKVKDVSIGEIIRVGY